jgi:hypothetical protein
VKDKAKNLEYAFEYVREFYNQIAQMLSDIIELMSKEGWEAPAGAVYADLSYSIDYPDKWMASYVYKNFSHKKFSSYVKGVVIFFNEYVFEVPISIVCGRLDQSSDDFEKWGIWHLAWDNSEMWEKLNGEVISLDTEIKDKKITGKIFAIPLTDIQGSHDVKEKVVKRLLSV